MGISCKWLGEDVGWVLVALDEVNLKFAQID